MLNFISMNILKKSYAPEFGYLQDIMTLDFWRNEAIRACQCYQQTEKDEIQYQKQVIAIEINNLSSFYFLLISKYFSMLTLIKKY